MEIPSLFLMRAVFLPLHRGWRREGKRGLRQQPPEHDGRCRGTRRGKDSGTGLEEVPYSAQNETKGKDSHSLRDSTKAGLTRSIHMPIHSLTPSSVINGGTRTKFHILSLQDIRFHVLRIDDDLSILYISSALIAFIVQSTGT